jgi:anti-anti-sigma regulatory factor
MEDQGKMVVTNPNDAVMDVFSVTGFDDILTIE